MEEYKGKVPRRLAGLPAALPPQRHARRHRGPGRRRAGQVLGDARQAVRQPAPLDRASLEKYAQELGLNMGKVQGRAGQQEVQEADQGRHRPMGDKIGARGTPAFFINGKFLSGAQPFEAFKARDRRGAGQRPRPWSRRATPKAKVYETIMKDAKAEVAAAPAAAARQARRRAGARGRPDRLQGRGRATRPSRGPKNAPITVVVFSDFQCPFCSGWSRPSTQLEKEYPGKIRVVWKDFPLALPPERHARPPRPPGPPATGQVLADARQAVREPARAGSAQPGEVRPGAGPRHGQVQGRPGQRQVHGAEIDADMAGRRRRWASTGTPASFINGRKIGGAYPYDTFKKMVEQELAKTSARGRAMTGPAPQAVAGGGRCRRSAFLAVQLLTPRAPGPGPCAPRPAGR